MSNHRGNKKYESIIKTGHDLFWKHGFKRVTVEEICREANASKMTFYKFFPNKLELAKAVFDKVMDEGLETFKNILHDDSTAPEKMKSLIRMKLEGVHDVSKEFLSDFYGDNAGTGLRAHIEKKYREVWNEMLNDFKVAQRKGTFRKDLNMEFYIYVSQKLVGLVNDPYLMDLFPTAEDLIMELTNLLIYGIAPHD